MNLFYISPATAAVQNIGPAAADQRLTPSKLLVRQPPDQPELYLRSEKSDAFSNSSLNYTV